MQTAAQNRAEWKKVVCDYKLHESRCIEYNYCISIKHSVTNYNSLRDATIKLAARQKSIPTMVWLHL